MVRRTLLVLGLAAFVVVLVVREGPPAGGDTTSLTAPTTALSHGDLHAAAYDSVLPNPPGYALLATPFVVALRAWIGSGTWCASPSRVRALRDSPLVERNPVVVNDIGACGVAVHTSNSRTAQPVPPWWQAQGLIAVLAWLIMVAGALVLLHSIDAGGGWIDVGVVWGLAVLPAASSAIVVIFHPQDMLCLGLGLLALAAVFRQRWVAAGVLFGLALVTKQFALLMLLPALVAVPARSRWRLLAVAAGVVAVVVAPFVAVAPTRTIDNLIGIGSAGAVKGATVVGLLSVSPTVESLIARGAPIALAIGLCAWAWRRDPATPAAPVPVLGLTLACLAGRLVLESVMIPYYLLAASVVFVLLDLARRQLPARSFAWIAATATFVVLPIHSRPVDAVGTLILTAVAVAVGIHDVVVAPGPGLDAALVTPGSSVATVATTADAGADARPLAAGS